VEQRSLVQVRALHTRGSSDLRRELGRETHPKIPPRPHRSPRRGIRIHLPWHLTRWQRHGHHPLGIRPHKPRSMIMALYPVPWFTTGGVEGEGGAENYGELARADAFIGSSGATGVIDPTDFAVSALPTPGAAVRVVKGTGVIRSTYPGVVGQSYVVQERDHTDVPVEATGSSGAAKKYVYLLIEDTQYTGQPPESVEDGPYNSYHVTTTLPQFQPYLLLGEINQPKSTA